MLGRSVSHVVALLYELRLTAGTASKTQVSRLLADALHGSQSPEAPTLAEASAMLGLLDQAHALLHADDPPSQADIR